MQGSGQEEGDGDEIMPNATDDSSEEGEDDEEEALRIREGFIVDEDEDEEEDEEEERRRRRKKRKKHHRRREEEDEELEEDDLELLAENTGGTFKKNRLTRLRRGRVSESPPATSSRRRNVVESSDEDLDNDDNLPQVQDIQKIWDDERGRDDEEEYGDMDLDDFIEYDEEGGGAMDEASRAERRREQQELQRRKRAFGSRPELAGIDANAWDEIHDVFGDGHDYDWALVGEDEMEQEEERYRPDTKYQDVFEPSEIRKRMLTDDDDLIRVQDIPERMQLAVSSLSGNTILSTHTAMTEVDLDGAAMWVTQRISTRKNREYFSADGQFQHLKGALVMAVTFALRYLFVEEFEVPHIWSHKRDYLCHFDISDIRTRKELLSLTELWRIYALGQKYRSLLERKKALSTLHERLQVHDEFYEKEILPKVDSVELVADATEWLLLKYKEKKNDGIDSRSHEEEESDIKKPKMPSRISAYEVAKKSIVSKLAEGFGLKSYEVVANFMASERVHFVQDQELNPTTFAEQFADPDPVKTQTPAELLRRARLILSTELGKDPLLRDYIRRLFREEAQITVEPTERGIVKIDQNHPYNNFKYLLRKPIRDMLEIAQFLHILAAEAEHLVTISIFLPNEPKADLEQKLNNAFSSDNFSEAARAWNVERSHIVQDVIEQHLIPLGAKWVREYLREEVEDFLAQSCAVKLRKRINAAPYITPGMKPGDTSSVLAVSWGKGDPQKDAISMVFLDEAGRMREHTKIDNLYDEDNLDEFIDLLKRRKPDVIVIGGFSMATLKLKQRVREVLDGRHTQATGNESGRATEHFGIPVTYVHDDVARIYQHSNRAAEEFSGLSSNAKYCIGLARYAQSPLNEFAALGRDITAITFEEDDQHLVPVEKLLMVFERALVDVTNKVGVDINRAVTDSYYQHLLPFICGLGPRKAQALVKKIGALGGTLINRDQFIKGSLLTTKIFLNASAFLRIAREDNEMRSFKNRRDDDDAPDPLDDTRIHPEDYELARKMATDALELDEEDIHDEHPSHVVTLIMNDPDNEKKLVELNLDEFAISLYQANYDQKRHTLNVIRDELLKPYAEQRDPFLLPQDMEIVTMLSGETERTLRHGLMVSAVVYRTARHLALVRLDSGVEGIINSKTLSDGNVQIESFIRKGQTVSGIIIHRTMQLDQDMFSVELSCQRQLLEERDDEIRKVRPDIYYDTVREAKDKEMLNRKKRAETDRSRRVIKHPNFHNFKASQTETFLEKQQRGDVVIRPSSKGIDHLAVTWKVDDKLYQHIDVTDSNADPTGQTTGQLIVDAQHTYADLDELIVNHVQAMARRVEELMAHEKFKQGPEDELHLFLKNSLAANPAKSMYGFTLNRKRPGHFNLCFLANKNSTVQTWPVRVAPEAYYLFDAAAVGVPELCDAFKVR
ncbi:transcription elongation factor SPT6 [Macrolepiota fuliginosa MF-IS2]|uniref:Transcription elongation factor Spt6 n=1 Tax=Macrolepiota fuliginosa MF-IS2 TaxID=1400762 RepID=A0A9P5XNC0_9AGAR|nr:transcription elongation factor SPT6 [Macrolepiota fuliginosa MF-IS2]